MILKEILHLANLAYDDNDLGAMSTLKRVLRQEARIVNDMLREFEKYDFRQYSYKAIQDFIGIQRGGRARRVLSKLADNADAYDIYNTIAEYRRFQNFKTFDYSAAQGILADRVANMNSRLYYVKDRKKKEYDINEGSEFLNMLGYLQSKLPKVYTSGDEIEIIDGLMSKDIDTHAEREELVDAYIQDYIIGQISARQIYEDVTGRDFYARSKVRRRRN